MPVHFVWPVIRNSSFLFRKTAGVLILLAALLQNVWRKACDFVTLGCCAAQSASDRQVSDASDRTVQSADAQPVATTDDDRITQISVINALMLGHYDGVVSIREMLAHGNFGLGTLDHLDGELIVLDGNAYQVRGNGRVVEVDPNRTTPFAIVTELEGDGELDFGVVPSLADLDRHLDDRIAHQNNFVAIRLDGQFASITVRSVKRQEIPYPPLAEVAKGQGVWTYKGLRGTLVGIRCPQWVEGLNVPGFHWHFISDDRDVGGHVLSCQIRQAHVRYDICSDWVVKLPDSPSFNTLVLDQDLREELKDVERSRADPSTE